MLEVICQLTSYFFFSRKSPVNLRHYRGEIPKHGSAGILCLIEDAKWALFAKSAAGGTIPQGTACEECYRLWSKAFSFVPYDELVERVKKDMILKAAVMEARSAQAGASKTKLLPEEVSAVTGMSFDVERSFLVASERDMRRAAGLQRVGKLALKGLPAVTVSAEDGSGKEEVLYLFADPQSPLRRGKLRVSLSTSHQTVKMQPCDVLWAGQGEQYHNMAWQTQVDENKLKEVVAKELAGHLNLMSWESFVSERLGHGGSAQECEKADSDAELMEMSNEPPTLLGVAAVEEAGSRWTPQPKSKKSSPSLVKQGSFRSQSAASVLDGAASVSSKLPGSEHAPSCGDPEEQEPGFFFFQGVGTGWGGGKGHQRNNTQNRLFLHTVCSQISGRVGPRM